MTRRAEEEEDDDDVNVDELFKSIVESKIIRKNPDDRGTMAKLTSVHAEGVNLKDPLVIRNLGQVMDIEYVREDLPSLTEFKLKPAMIFKLVKDLIGKDLSKLTLPVFVNEPFSFL